MAFELVLLGALIFIFIVSFCGLLQKVKQTYTRERLLAARQIAERMAQRRDRQLRRRSVDSFTEIYMNPTFNASSNGGIFPSAPPPYSQNYVEPPPKYEEAIKIFQPNSRAVHHPAETHTSGTTRPDSGLPPYTITLTTPIEPSAPRQQ